MNSRSMIEFVLVILHRKNCLSKKTDEECIINTEVDIEQKKRMKKSRKDCKGDKHMNKDLNIHN